MHNVLSVQIGALKRKEEEKEMEGLFSSEKENIPFIGEECEILKHVCIFTIQIQHLS